MSAAGRVGELVRVAGQVAASASSMTTGMSRTIWQKISLLPDR